MSIERRSMTIAAAGRTITGKIPYNSMSVDLGGFTEKIAPGAFRRSLVHGNEVLALWNHDPSKPLARRSNESLQLRDTETGLEAEITPDGTSFGEDAQRSIESGTVQGLSFGFSIREEHWQRSGGQWTRTLLDADLVEISPTVAPAYPASSASVS